MDYTKMKVNVADEDHLWIDGKQFVSLKRFLENRKEIAGEVLKLERRNRELEEENNALKVLLKEHL